jgi:hypothetical protein
MVTYSVTLSDAEVRAMEFISINPQDWISNVMQHRAYTATAALSDLEMAKAMKAGRPILTDREKLVEASDEPAMAAWVSEEEYDPNPNNPFAVPTVKIN